MCIGPMTSSRVSLPRAIPTSTPGKRRASTPRVGLALALVLLACADVPPTTESTCRDAAAAFCAKADSCSMGVWPLQHFAGPGDCIARFSLGCSTMAAHPHARVTAAALRGCVEAIRQRQCGNLGLSPFSLVECTFTGSLPEGAACSDNSQCQSRDCYPLGISACGRCRAPAVIGSDCFDSASRCSRVGLACSGGDSPTCIPTPPATLQAGAECFPFRGSICAEGLVCGGSRCHPLASSRTIGVSCDAECEPWASCDDVTYRCVAQAVASVGERCGYVAARMPPIWCANGECSRARGSNTGTCVAWAADGAPCSIETAGPFCRPPARCVLPESRAGNLGTCRLPGAVTCP
jgi:hypothetical protein